MALFGRATRQNTRNMGPRKRKNQIIEIDENDNDNDDNDDDDDDNHNDGDENHNDDDDNNNDDDVALVNEGQGHETNEIKTEEIPDLDVNDQFSNDMAANLNAYLIGDNQGYGCDRQNDDQNDDEDGDDDGVAEDGETIIDTDSSEEEFSDGALINEE